MERIRIVLVALPRMLRDLITELAAERPAWEITSAAGTDLLAAAEAWDADVVVVGADAAEPGSVTALLGGRPDVRAVAVDGDGREGVIYELRPHREALGELSPSTLLGALRPRPREWFA